MQELNHIQQPVTLHENHLKHILIAISRQFISHISSRNETKNLHYFVSNQRDKLKWVTESKETHFNNCMVESHNSKSYYLKVGVYMYVREQVKREKKTLKCRCISAGQEHLWRMWLGCFPNVQMHK